MLLYYQAHEAGRDDDEDVRRDKSDSPAVPTPPLQAGTVNLKNGLLFGSYILMISLLTLYNFDVCFISGSYKKGVCFKMKCLKMNSATNSNQSLLLRSPTAGGYGRCSAGHDADTRDAAPVHAWTRVSSPYVKQ